MNKPYQIAIVGGGPRALFAVERLALEYEDASPGRGLEVTVLDTTGQFGAGNIYAPGQPSYLIMNFATRHIDVWSEESHRRRSSTRLTLTEWLTRNHPTFSDPDAYVPRSLVGDYLMNAFSIVLDELPDGMSVSLIKARVSDLRKVGERWELTTPTKTSRFDSVLLATGHDGWRHADPTDFSLRVYPVTQFLSERIITTESLVGIKGFGLTCIDACLALSEGRDGKFADLSDGDRQYVESGREPRSIYVYSRSGRPMLPKPDRRRAMIPNTWDSVWERYSRAISQLGPHYSFPDDLCRLLWNAADEAVAITGNLQEKTTREWFDEWMNGVWDAERIFKQLSVSLSSARGDAPPSHEIAIAEAWRNLYPALVRKLQHGGLPVTERENYEGFASEMERIAFGPPAENVSKMLALIDCGLVQLCDKPLPGAILIDARIPSPSAWSPTSPLGLLEEKGEVERIQEEKGIRVDSNARPFGKAGRLKLNLGVVGRATEGCVIGNDTLSRTLNKHVDRWASQEIQILSASPKESMSLSAA
ncbi:MAG: FAD/NAD(P)-binding protein [Verrucomicrobiales bacterium]|nr:FAD/NAD(P)-binding protein [Verrucomicrobiales bacterium]